MKNQIAEEPKKSVPLDTLAAYYKRRAEYFENEAIHLAIALREKIDEKAMSNG